MSNYAIVEDRGKQYKVAEGDLLEVDLHQAMALDADFDFSRVVYYRNGDDIRVGTPVVENVDVTAKVVMPEKKGKKIYVRHFQRRKNVRTRTGHRQRYTIVRIEKIEAK